jgi:hypothetical protein
MTGVSRHDLRKNRTPGPLSDNKYGLTSPEYVINKLSRARVEPT